MGYIGAGISRFNTADELTVTGDATIDTTTLVVDSTNNNVGIGTATPAKPLTVVGGDFSTVLLDNSNASHGTQILFQANGATNSGCDIQMSDAGGMKIRTLAVEPLSFHTSASAGSPSERMRLTSDGKIGIGTASPDALLQIEKSDSGTTIDKEPSSQSGPNIAIHNSNQTANNLSSVQFTNRGTNGVAETATAGIHVKHEAQGGTYSYGSMNFNTTNSAGSYATRMHIASGGNVGIGTDSPTIDGSLAGLSINSSGNLLHINDGDGATLKLTDPATGANRGLGISLQNTEAVISNCESGSLRFGTGNAERARFDSSGRLLVGKTAAGIGNTGVEIRNTNDILITKADDSALFLNRLNTDGSIVEFRRTGNTVGTISVTGSATSYNTSSDIRLKQDIEPLVATDKLMQMNPVSYNWKSDPDGPRSMGFIAQEMADVMPEAVSTGDDDDDMMSMDYGRITPILVSALQDAHRKIDELAAEIAELKAS